MLRKLTIVSALAVFLGALTLSTAADAWYRGGHGWRGGYGWRHGYGWRGGYGYPAWGYYGYGPYYGGCWRWWYGQRVFVC